MLLIDIVATVIVVIVIVKYDEENGDLCYDCNLTIYRINQLFNNINNDGK